MRPESSQVSKPFAEDKFAGHRLLAEVKLTRMELRIERAIKRALSIHKKRALAAASAQHLTAAAPPDAFGLDAWDSSINDEVLPIIGNVMEDLATSVSSFLQLSPEIRAQLLGKIDVASRTANFVDKVRTIGSDISAQLIEELTVGIAKGEGTAVLARRIDSVFDVGNRIAERVVRTETHGASEGTSHASANAISAAGYEVTKSWIDTADERTRESHRQAAADNQDIPLDQPYRVGGYELDYPGDPDGPADEVIRCRCSQKYSLDGALCPLKSGDMPDL